MNIEEINSLQVGDLIAFEEYDKFDPKFHIGIRQDEHGNELSFDCGLVEEITPYEIIIVWFSGCEDDSCAIREAHWEDCRKLQ